jgi:hypothetical protein
VRVRTILAERWNAINPDGVARRVLVEERRFSAASAPIRDWGFSP